jgi:hypothetical protein
VPSVRSFPVGNYLIFYRELRQASNSSAFCMAQGIWTLLISTPICEVVGAGNRLVAVELGKGSGEGIHLGSKEAGPRVAAIVSIIETCRRRSLPIRELSTFQPLHGSASGISGRPLPLAGSSELTGKVPFWRSYPLAVASVSPSFLVCADSAGIRARRASSESRK